MSESAELSKLRSRTLWDTLLASAQRSPERAALIASDDAGGMQRVTYQALVERIRNLSSGLASIGVRRGDRLVLWMTNSIDWVVTSFAVYTVGAVLVPLNTRYRGEEAGHVLRTSRARLLFTVTDLLGSDLVELLVDVTGLDFMGCCTFAVLAEEAKRCRDHLASSLGREPRGH